ncbi:hypothetical protein X763_17575 [Mesorhizobium sp. LSHC432A00]|nr:hypothetical protein X763_17575 [Mesorhizobium sp. LSHC432A00]
MLMGQGTGLFELCAKRLLADHETFRKTFEQMPPPILDVRLCQEF